MPAHTRHDQKLATRKALLVAARALFAARGFEGTTLRDVAAAANVAVGTVFLHFADKRALLAEALHDDLTRVLSDPLPADVAPGLPALLHVARRLYAYYAENPELSRTLVKESLIAPPTEPGEHVLRDFLAFAAGTLQEAQVIPPGVSPDHAAAVFFSAYLLVLLTALRAGHFDVGGMITHLDHLLRVTFQERSPNRESELLT